MDWVNFSIEVCLNRIKDMKKSNNVNCALMLFMVAVIIFDAYEIYYYPHNAMMFFGLGMIAINMVWFLTSFFEYKAEIRWERERLKTLEELKDKRLSDGEMAQYENAKNRYEELNAELMSRLKLAGADQFVGDNK